MNLRSCHARPRSCQFRDGTVRQSVSISFVIGDAAHVLCPLQRVSSCRYHSNTEGLALADRYFSSHFVVTVANNICSDPIARDVVDCAIFESNEDSPEVDNRQGSQTVNEQSHVVKYHFPHVQVLPRRNFQSNLMSRLRENSSVAVAGTTSSTDTERDIRRNMLGELTADLKVNMLHHRWVNNRLNSCSTLRETSKDKNDTIDQQNTQDHRLVESVHV